MALARFQRTLTDTLGNVRNGVDVTIRDESTGGVAAIFSDKAGTTAKNNPVTTDSFGFFSFYASPGRYRIQATGVDWRDEDLVTVEGLDDAVTAAEAARDAAQLNAGIYADTTAGLAATSDGDYFSTPSGDSNEYLILYRNDTGSATQIAVYPTVAGADEAIRNELVQPVATYNILQEMKDDASLLVGRKVRTLGYSAIGDGGGAVYEIVASGTGSNYGFIFEQLTASGHEASLIDGGIMEDKTAFVPSDYASVNAAIQSLHGRLSVASGVRVTIKTETGHAWSEGIDCRHGDYGYFLIDAVDSTVLLDAGFVPVSVPASVPTTYSNPVMYCENSVAPEFGVQVDAELKDVAGTVYYESRAIISSLSGVDNANRMGLVAAKSSLISGHGCRYRNAGDGNRITTGSHATLFEADLSGARALTEVQAACLDVSRGSYVNVAANPTQTAANLSGAAKFGINCRRSIVSADRANCSGCGTNGIVVSKGGQVLADGADLSGAGSHALQTNAGKANVVGGNLSGSGARAIDSDKGSEVNANDANLTNAGTSAINANRGCKIAANAADVTGFDTTSSGVDAVRTFNGSIISANAMTGSPTFSQAVNTVTNSGIIFS